MLSKARYGNFEVLKNVWFRQKQGSFGVVKCRDMRNGKIKYFAGICNPFMSDEWTDICWIIDNGNKVNLDKMEVVR